MQALHHKLLRDILHLRGQVMAVAAVVACGIAVFVLMRSMFESLEYEQSHFYEEYNFADVFASLKEAPQYVSDRISEIPGVSSVTTRLVFTVTLNVPGLDEAATGRFVSLPFYGKPTMNGIFLREGRFPEPSRDDEAIANETFMNANKLHLGDSVSAVLNGRLQAFRIVGVGLSPEFVYAVSGGTSIFPDDKHFGVFWVSRKALEHAFDITGSFNDVTLHLSRTANKADVIAALDLLLRPYGSIGSYDRTQQISHQFLQAKIDQYKSMSDSLPILFLAVAAFLIHIILTRLIATEREQIAVLKAFGYTSTRIAIHYLEFAMVTVLIGAFAGIVLGVWGGSGVLGLLLKYFHFPTLIFHLDVSTFFFSFGVTAIASLLGALNSVRAAVKLPPAEAMRPEAPALFKQGFFEHLGVQRILSTSGRMALRDFERKPIKSLLSMVTIAFAVALLIAGGEMNDSIRDIVTIEFFSARHDDLSVGFRVPRPEDARYDLSRMPGVLRVEGSRTVPVDLSLGSRKKRLAIQGLDRMGTLRQLVDAKRRIHAIPLRGLALTSYLAHELHANVGDTLRVEVLEGHQRTTQMIVEDTIDELLGISAYMDIANIGLLTGEDQDYSEAQLTIDPRSGPAIQHALENMPLVTGVSLRTGMIDDYQKTLADSMLTLNLVFILFASVLAFGVVYNSGRITLSERGREFASLRVLGFTKREVAMIMIGQQTAIVLLGMPLGFAIGYLLNKGLGGAYASELFRLPFEFSSQSLGYAAIVVLAAGIVSNIFIIRRIYQLDIIEVLKTRE